MSGASTGSATTFSAGEWSTPARGHWRIRAAKLTRARSARKLDRSAVAMKLINSMTAILALITWAGAVIAWFYSAYHYIRSDRSKAAKGLKAFLLCGLLFAAFMMLPVFANK